jgi:hypothetical protein
LCNVASCWIYIGIILVAHPILHISRIRVKVYFPNVTKYYITYCEGMKHAVMFLLFRRKKM